MMKFKGIATALILFLPLFTFAQVLYQSPLRVIGGFGSTGAVRWTNEIPTTQPVYEILRASTVTGAWTHFFYVTNASSTTITNALGVSPSAIFHKLAWIGDTQTVFNYVFDEGFGQPAVIGQLKLTFVPGPNLGVWFCAEVGSVNHRHPTGSAPFAGGGVTVTPSNHFVRLNFTPIAGDSGVYLEGSMQLGMTNGRPVYTSFAGTVFENGIVGPSPIGTFTATRGQ
ncbi:MAG TPA: hypothetical protein VGF13_12205 [Verrucomicrobiae bacterium]|jgi:hypothetical protein